MWKRGARPGSGLRTTRGEREHGSARRKAGATESFEPQERTGHGVVLRVLVKVRENVGKGLVWWQGDARASRFDGNLLTSLSFSGDTGAPKKY